LLFLARPPDRLQTEASGLLLRFWSEQEEKLLFLLPLCLIYTHKPKNCLGSQFKRVMD
jgi:hypothetical protein